MMFRRFAICPVCGMKPRASWLFGDPTGETFWTIAFCEQVCRTCAWWAHRLELGLS